MEGRNNPYGHGGIEPYLTKLPNIFRLGNKKYLFLLPDLVDTTFSMEHVFFLQIDEALDRGAIFV